MLAFGPWLSGDRARECRDGRGSAIEKHASIHSIKPDR
jgi:hypothetical protein